MEKNQAPPHAPCFARMLTRPVIVAFGEMTHQLLIHALRRPGGHGGVESTRSHSELGRETPQRRWYFVSRRGRVGRRQVCKTHEYQNLLDT